MSRYTFTAKDRANSHRTRRVGEAGRMRREAEMWLLEKLYAEMAMPEWYPER